jgi:hypothetical protein
MMSAANGYAIKCLVWVMHPVVLANLSATVFGQQVDDL